MKSRSALIHYLLNPPIPEFRELYGSSFGHPLMRIYGRILNYIRDGATSIQVTPTIITVKVNDSDLERIPPLRNPEEYPDLATYELETRVRNSAFTIIKLILEKDPRFLSLVNVVRNTSEEILIEIPPEE